MTLQWHNVSTTNTTRVRRVRGDAILTPGDSIAAESGDQVYFHTHIVKLDTPVLERDDSQLEFLTPGVHSGSECGDTADEGALSDAEATQAHVLPSRAAVYSDAAANLDVGTGKPLPSGPVVATGEAASEDNSSKKRKLEPGQPARGNSQAFTVLRALKVAHLDSLRGDTSSTWRF